MPKSTKKAGSINLSGLLSPINKNPTATSIVGPVQQGSTGSGSGGKGNASISPINRKNQPGATPPTNSRRNNRGGKIDKKYDFGKRFGRGDIDDLKAQGYSRKDIKNFARKHVDRDQMMGTAQKRLGVHGGGRGAAPDSAADYDPSQIGMSKRGGNAADKYNMNDINYLRNKGGGFSDKEIAKAVRKSGSNKTDSASEFERDTLGVAKNNKYGKVFSMKDANALKAEGYKKGQIRKYMKDHVKEGEIGGRAQMKYNVGLPGEGPESLADYNPADVGWGDRNHYARGDIQYLKSQGFGKKAIAKHIINSDAKVGQDAQKFLDRFMSKHPGLGKGSGGAGGAGGAGGKGGDVTTIGDTDITQAGDDINQAGRDLTQTEAGRDINTAGRDLDQSEDMYADQKNDMDIDIADSSKTGVFGNKFTDDRDIERSFNNENSLNRDYGGFTNTQVGGDFSKQINMQNFYDGIDDDAMGSHMGASAYANNINGQSFLTDGFGQLIGLGAQATAQKYNPYDINAEQSNIQERSDTIGDRAAKDRAMYLGDPFGTYGTRDMWRTPGGLSGPTQTNYQGA